MATRPPEYDLQLEDITADVEAIEAKHGQRAAREYYSQLPTPTKFRLTQYRRAQKQAAEEATAEEAGGDSMAFSNQLREQSRVTSHSSPQAALRAHRRPGTAPTGITGTALPSTGATRVSGEREVDES